MITGKIKFFEQNSFLFKNGGTITATSGTDTAKYVLGTNQYLEWESIGSNDATTEDLIIEVPTAVTIDRLFLVAMNFKGFNVQYDVASSWTDFTNVSGIDGDLGGGIVEATYARDTAYYEFDAVSTTKIRIQATTTQVVNDEKRLRTFIGAEELGTLEGFPRVKNKFNRNTKSKKALSGKYSFVKSFDTLDSTSIDFKVNPFQNDQDIVEELYDRDDPFLIWFNGGRENTDPINFKLQVKGWNLSDVYQVQTDGKLDPNYFNNLYKAGTVISMKIRESID